MASQPVNTVWDGKLVTPRDREIYQAGMNAAHALILRKTTFYMGKALFESAKTHAKEMMLELCEQCSVQNCHMPVASKFLCRKHYDSSYQQKRRSRTL